jgi:hypothetical protein
VLADGLPNGIREPADVALNLELAGSASPEGEAEAAHLIKQSTQRGAHGIYPFELKVPDVLRRGFLGSWFLEASKALNLLKIPRNQAKGIGAVNWFLGFLIHFAIGSAITSPPMLT